MVDTDHIDAGPIARGEVGHYGASATCLTFAETTISTAWNVQGDAERQDFADATRRLFGIVPSAKSNSTARAGALTALWLGPRSWLLVAGGASALTDFDAKRDALNQAGGALFDVSASRTAWALAGPDATTVLAKACPLDFHPRTFVAGACAQSVYGHINVLVEKRDETPTFTLMVARSFARDLGRALGIVAAQYGFEVLAARPYG